MTEVRNGMVNSGIVNINYYNLSSLPKPFKRG
jgi:hypothetical protein